MNTTAGRFRICGALFSLISATTVHGAMAPVLGPEYSVPDKYVTTSYGPTVEAAVEAWWDKYRLYWGVEPYGSLQCAYEIRPATSGPYYRVARVHLTGSCHGSDPVNATASCPEGYDFVYEVCVENGEPIEEKTEPDECNSTGNPVNYTTGNKFFQEMDLPPTGNGNLSFRRTWNSHDRRWHFSFGQYLTDVETSLRTVSVYREDGRVVRFTEREGAWVADADIRDRLELDGSDWLYTDSSGRREWFTSDGDLKRIIDPQGNIVRMPYPGSNTLQPRDEYDNQLVIRRNSLGGVDAVEDTDGRRFDYKYDAAGRLTHVSYPDDTPDASGDNAFGTDNPVREYHYEDPVDPLLLTGITDENGVRYKTVAYDDAGRAILSGLGDGSIDASTLDYSGLDDSADPHVRVTNALGKETVYHLESHFGVNRVSRVDGVASDNCLADVRYRSYYGDTGWLERSIDRAGVATFHEYYLDEARYGLPRRRVEAEGTAQERVFTFDWEPWTRLMTRQTLEGVRETVYTYDGDRRLLSRVVTDLSTDPVPYATQGNTRTWTYSYTFQNEALRDKVASVAIDGPRTDVSDITLYELTSRGYLSRITDAAGNTTVFTNHTGRGQPRSMIDSNGTQVRLQYTPRGWLASVELENGENDAVTTFDFDRVGQLLRVVDPSGSALDYTYDAGRRLRSLRNGRGESVALELDAAGNPLNVETRDASQHITGSSRFVYDELGRLLRKIGSYGQVTGYSYDPNGNLSGIATGPGRLGSLEYDALNRLSGITYPDSSAASLQSDSQGSVTQVVDQRGLATRLRFDGFGNLKQAASPDSGTTRYHYDAAGNPVSMTDARGVTSVMTYDALNRLTAVSYPGDPSRDIGYSYDNGDGCTSCNGRLREIRDHSGTTRFAYDFAGRVVSRVNTVVLPGGGELPLATAFSYDLAGRPLSVGHPNGEVVAYRRDAAGQVDGVSRLPAAGGPAINVAANIRHDPFGPVTALDYANGLALSRDYDLDGRLARQIIPGVQDRSYQYDIFDNIWKIDDLLHPTRSESYSYDLLNRLLGATGLYGSIDYAYDAAGNRVSRAIDRGGPPVAESYTYDTGSNRLVEYNVEHGDTTGNHSFQYDANGNLVEALRPDGSRLRPDYDVTNRMISVDP